MSLSSTLRRRLRKAISSAFTDYDQLRMVIGEGDWTGLPNIQLEKIAKPDEMPLVIFKLVAWAEREGRVQNLFNVCIQENGTNALLNALRAEVQLLQEEPTDEDADDVRIDDQQYKLAPKPLRFDQWQMVTTSSLLILVTLMLFAGWCLIFFEQSHSAIWGLAVAIPAGIWAVIGEDPRAMRVRFLMLRVLASRYTFGAALSLLLLVCLITFTRTRIHYLAFDGAPQVELVGKMLMPGETTWVWTRPWGRTLEIAERESGYLHQTMIARPWKPNKLRLEFAPSVIILPPDSELTAISTTAVDPQQIWQLEISVKSGSDPRHASLSSGSSQNAKLTIRPYRGGPVVLRADDAFEPKLSGIAIKRPKQVEKRTMLILPDDQLEVILSRGPVKHSTSVKVAVAHAHGELQQVHIPEQVDP